MYLRYDWLFGFTPLSRISVKTFFAAAKSPAAVHAPISRLYTLWSGGSLFSSSS